MSIAELADGIERLESGDASGAGELLFNLGRLVEYLGVDPEDAARRAASAFRERVRAAESAGGADDLRIDLGISATSE